MTKFLQTNAVAYFNFKA